MLASDQVITDVLDHSFREYKNNRAFTCLGRTLTFQQVDELSARFANYLQTETKLQPGDRIAIQLPNILQYPIAIFGALRAGLVEVNTNPMYTAREIKHQLNDSGAKVLIVLANVAATAASVIDETGVEKVIVTEIGDLHSPFKKLLINGVLKYVKRAIPPFHFKNQVDFTTTLEKAPSYTPVKSQPDDVAMLQYTGGTTGVAKGAMLTHANLVANRNQLNDRLSRVQEVGANHTHVAPLPLYHIYAFTGHCMSIFGSGNHNLLIPNPRDIPAFVKALKSEKIYGFVGLNTLFIALCANKDFRKLDFSHMAFTSSGGMALTGDGARQWKETTGFTPSEGYGLTETSPVVASNDPTCVQLGTVGKAVKDTEVKVVNEAGETLPQGQVGELCVRGPQVMKGYWQRPEATAEVIDTEGFFHTGDMAMLQEDGFIRIVDRKKDMILVSGFNVYPNEVEDVAGTHPDVIEAGAIGVDDSRSGEVVKLYVVRSNPALTEQQVQDHCRQHLAAYKVPKFIEFCESLPKTAVGKILRRELKAINDNKVAS